MQALLKIETVPISIEYVEKPKSQGPSQTAQLQVSRSTDQLNIRSNPIPFSMDHVAKNPAVFDIDKLNWLNSNYLKNADAELITELALPHIMEAGYIEGTVDEALKDDLVKFIEKEKKRGSSNINTYLVVLYKKYSVPISAFILTIIAVAVSSMKRRGGMGINLVIGIVIAFGFIFMDKVFGVMAEKASAPPILLVWLPNIIFGILAIYLLRNAKR